MNEDILKFGDKGLDETPDKPCKIHECVNYEYENGLCETHVDEIENHDCKLSPDSSCDSIEHLK